MRQEGWREVGGFENGGEDGMRRLGSRGDGGLKSRIENAGEGGWGERGGDEEVGWESQIENEVEQRMARG